MKLREVDYIEVTFTWEEKDLKGTASRTYKIPVAWNEDYKKDSELISVSVEAKCESR